MPSSPYERVYDTLRDTDRDTPEAIAEHLNLSVDEVNAALTQLEKDGQVEKQSDDDGEYWINF